MSVHEEIREQQKKLKGQGFKAHLEYFWEYYKIHTAIALFVIILLSMLIHDIRANKPYAFYAVMLNAASSPAEEVLEKGFSDYAEIDTDNYSCLIDTSSTFDLSVMTETTIATSQKIMANIAGGDLDILGADSDIFTYYANQNVFVDLRTIISPEQIKEYEDKLVYVDQAYLDYLDSEAYQNYVSTGEFDPNNKYAVMADKYNKDLTFTAVDKSEMENPVPVGIKLDSSNIIKESGAYQSQSPVAGVVLTSKHTDLAIKYFEFLLK
ncbi:hypothetical protein [Butyrivibrio sp. YAB3001]|uniref:hypothetical protein n=1 Tax=Butyrivibrio sp. YAB3001 TaxID=1520812 RepID=UPI0008F64430|nr:hypothetical protein [Butyrivibrio sp. YAB3001]SFB85915.1 hypothetical protein SAMN02910398_00899 [Butyrivibrio sp. YAB3001]